MFYCTILPLRACWSGLLLRSTWLTVLLTKSSIECLLYVLNKSTNLQDQMTRKSSNTILLMYHLSQVVFCYIVFFTMFKTQIQGSFMPALYHQPQWTLKSMLKASFMEENNKILGNTCCHPHQFSLIRPKTQRVIHFLMYKYENCLWHSLPVLSFQMARRSWKVLGSTETGGRGEALLGSRNFLSCYEQLS